MNEWDVLDEFDALQKAISESFIDGKAYKDLCSELNKGQLLITAIASNGSSRSEGGESQSDYKICFNKEEKKVPFSVLDGKKLLLPGCYITGVDDNEKKTGEVLRIRLHLSKECTGAQQKVDGGVTKYYYDLVWPTGDPGKDWKSPDSKEDPKFNHKLPIGDYTLMAVDCAGMSTSATGLKISGSLATVGVTGVSVSCSLLAFNFGILLLKGIGLDYSVEALGTRSTAFESELETAQDRIDISNLMNELISNVVQAMENGDDVQED